MTVQDDKGYIRDKSEQWGLEAPAVLLLVFSARTGEWLRGCTRWDVAGYAVSDS